MSRSLPFDVYHALLQRDLLHHLGSDTTDVSVFRKEVALTSVSPRGRA
jgi:hypothetical protein